MKLSDAEWEIMNALWKGHPTTAREIMERLPDEVSWAYTTVKTMLTRLVSKQVVSERKRGNTSIYAPLITQVSARRSALRNLVQRVLGGKVEPIMHFLVEDQELTESERARLIQMLEEMDQTNNEGTDGTA